jgi:hypothetical protein
MAWRNADIWRYSRDGPHAVTMQDFLGKNAEKSLPATWRIDPVFAKMRGTKTWILRPNHVGRSPLTQG